MTQRDWQKDMEMCKDITSMSSKGEFVRMAEYWLQEAKERGEREQRLKVAIECAIEEYGLWKDKGRAVEVMITELKRELSTLYPDTPAPTPEIKQPVVARPIDEWHEDYGDVLWWEFPVCEPPYCGTPIDVDWPGYHTHWTPIVIPESPAPAPTHNIKGVDTTGWTWHTPAPKEGSS
ncbi:hypothetical protein GCM10010912_17880 [Paenibacillus albidus]|uniref:DUF551 domain-containing protein n=1 Tax=Paenibacillus albidus TaxID=2041023 RepID=A0A917C5Q0_9BACL|nr:hypothetical protein [Paenibacillus albidus]GGF73107.1 hypothetical protein GCM10010912_17880 [Paenibacillus albidus]